MIKADYFDLPLGSIFNLGYLKFVVAKPEEQSSDRCEQCYFGGNSNFQYLVDCSDIYDFIPNCHYSERTDGTNVVFKEIK